MVFNAVPIIIQIAGVAELVVVCIDLVRVGVIRTIIAAVVFAVSVDIAVAGVSYFVAIQILLNGVKKKGAIVKEVFRQVVVVVVVTEITLRVIVGVCLITVNR